VRITTTFGFEAADGLDAGDGFDTADGFDAGDASEPSQPAAVRAATRQRADNSVARAARGRARAPGSRTPPVSLRDVNAS
jgi:hypothetical protein